MNLIQPLNEKKIKEEKNEKKTYHGLHKLVHGRLNHFRIVEVLHCDKLFEGSLSKHSLLNKFGKCACWRHVNRRVDGSNELRSERVSM